MGRVIAVSGKGGAGKTIVASLLVRRLVEKDAGSLIAVDADPDSNLAEALDVAFEKTIGDLREDLTKEKPPPGVDNKSYLSGKAFEATVEADGFDLLVMGRPEGPGCYCAVNHILREIIDSTVNAYDYTVIDAEAGLEHLSRRTTRNVDAMLVVCDPSRKSFETAHRIRELASELEITFDDLGLVLNRVTDGNRRGMLESAKKTGIPVYAEVPEDPLVAEYDLGGKPLTGLPENSPVYEAVSKLAEKIL